MILDKEIEQEVLSTKMTNFGNRYLLKKFLEKYEIEYSKARLNRIDIRKIETIEDLLKKI